jgi:GWxTD domain-containing protein
LKNRSAALVVDEFLTPKIWTEREAFIVQFWKRLDPTPNTAENERKEEHYRRIGYANSRFATSKLKGWKTDRGRVYIVYGPSDEIESHPSGRNGGPPQENWLYHFIEGIGNRVIVSFVDQDRNGDYKWTQDPANKK